MIPGLNTDVRHKGKTFHIQTEDSGPENPVLITHVFLGGTILGTQRQNYGNETDEIDVRDRMRTQHRTMYHALLEGRFDDAARRPLRAKPSKNSIPLAKKRRGIHTDSPVTRKSRPAAPNVAPARQFPTTDVLTARTPLKGMAATIVAPMVTPPKRRTAAASSLIKTDEYTELSVLDIQPAEPRLAFPTALTGVLPLSDLTLTYLIEEPDET
ncbi:MAG: hypothetical protein ACI9U2_000600 [Bradymonadia bacterium]|jgi:hypothetical protein